METEVAGQKDWCVTFMALPPREPCLLGEECDFHPSDSSVGGKEIHDCEGILELECEYSGIIHLCMCHGDRP